jgi:hypothetical protein
MAASDAIAITGIALTFLVSAANLIFNLRSSSKTIFVNTVSSSRLKWIDSLRDKVSEFMAVSARFTQAVTAPNEVAGLLLQRDTLLHEIVLHLNPRDPEDQKIRILVDQVCELTGDRERSSEFARALIELRDATGIYLKKEWNRVKQESAKGLS